jgi:tRNA(His) 5'-end guanylyltransferase
MLHDSLGDRMKAYEVAARTVLPHRLPVIIRVDGKAFHTYTAKCERPFDRRLSDVMVSTAKRLCEEIQGAQLAYTQSDEISILVHGYKKFDTQSWFDNQVQKMTSIAAATASSHFSLNSWLIWGDWKDDTFYKPADVMKALRPATFDARVFIIPEADVCNYFLWRQQDATRNSVQMLARSLYSHKQCNNKNGVELQEMCFQKGHNWNDLEPRWKRGVCILRPLTNDRNPWHLDDQIPIFSQDRSYINDLLKLEEE